MCVTICVVTLLSLTRAKLYLEQSSRTLSVQLPLLSCSSEWSICQRLFGCARCQRTHLIRLPLSLTSLDKPCAFMIRLIVAAEMPSSGHFCRILSCPHPVLCLIRQTLLTKPALTLK